MRITDFFRTPTGKYRFTLCLKEGVYIKGFLYVPASYNHSGELQKSLIVSPKFSEGNQHKIVTANKATWARILNLAEMLFSERRESFEDFDPYYAVPLRQNRTRREKCPVCKMAFVKTNTRHLVCSARCRIKKHRYTSRVNGALQNVTGKETK